MTPEIILWLVMLVLFIVVEAGMVTLISLWFAVGSLAALIPALLGRPIWIQLIVFTAVSAVSLALLRPIARKYIKRPGTSTNSDRNIGQTGVCTERIDNDAGQGSVRLMGKEWTARSAGGSVIEEGALVRVESISGVKLIVSLEPASVQEPAAIL